MKICGSCGLELDKACFSKKQWQLPGQKRRCKQCVDKSTSPAGGAEAGHGGADGDLNEGPRPPPPVESLENDVAGTVGSSEGQTVEPRSPLPVQIADDVGRADETAEGTGGEEVCSICLDVFDNPVQLSCGHSFCEVCLDGWHNKSKFDVHQPRNCPVCRHRAKPSREIIAKLYVLICILSVSEEGGKDFDDWNNKHDDLMSSLLKMGHTEEEIVTMLKEYRDSQNLMPDVIANAAHSNDAQTILDWLGSPVDEGKLASEATGGLTMLHFTVMRGHKELASLLLQQGAPVDVLDSHGVTPILTALLKSGGLVNELVTVLYEWGASLEHHVPGRDGALTDTLLAKTPMFQNELVKRRCEIINLNQRKDLIGQTCIVEKYIAKKNRYKVTTEHTHETFLVGPDNLKQRDRTPEDLGYYVTFQDGDYKRRTFESNEECQEFVRSLRFEQESD